MGRVLGEVLAVLAIFAGTAEGRDLNGVGGYVGHQGRWFTDSDGRVMSFRGIVLPLRKAPYALDVQGFGEDDAQWLADNGFNLMQVRFTYGAIEPQPGRYDQAYIARVVRIVKWMTSRGIRVLLHSDQGNWGPTTHGRGFPDWATFTDGAANPDLGFGPNHLANDAVQKAFDNFWANRVTARGEGLQQGYAKGIGELARRLADDPLVLGLDILNEPWLGSKWPSCFPAGRSGDGASDAACAAFDREAVAPFYARAIPLLRPLMPRQMLFYEPVPTFDLGFRTYLADVGKGDGQIGFAFHPYCASDGGGANIPPIPAGELKEQRCAEEESKVLGEAIAHVARTGDALLSNEFGATGFAKTFERVLGLHERHLVPWTITAWCCRDFSGAPSGDIILDPRKPPTEDNFDQGKLRALIRPYPAALSGTPTAAAFDTTSADYTLRFTTRRLAGNARFAARSTSIVHVPRRPYPTGYVVRELRGARIASPPDATRLELTSTGQDDVELRLQRRPSGEPPALCRDDQPPRLRVTRLRLSRTGLSIAGRTADAGCTATAGAFGRPGGVSRTVVELRRLSGPRCTSIESRKASSPGCTRIQAVARGRRRWRLQRSLDLPPGRYQIQIRARDAAGNRVGAARRTTIRW